MEPTSVERKLAAILNADVKGYSRLMQADEVGTVRTLTAYRELMATFIREHRGRVVDATGDNLLAEFPSVVDGVQCAVGIQQALEARNAGLPEDRRMEFRIGINLGDVIVDGERIYGDGVNIAARLESLAEAGGICIAGSAWEQVRNKLALGFEFLGAHHVKNIAEPVRVYRVRMDAEGAGPRVRRRRPAWLRQWRAAALTVMVLGAGAIAFWSLYPRLWPAAGVVSQGETALPLPDEPSIAVLPFANMSADPAQDYFSDGLTDALITQLYKIPNLFVIARTSSAIYKGKAVKVQQVGRELGVRWVLEGSVQKAGERVRIQAQLIEAASGKHVWAESYDRDLKDVFAVQDGILRSVVTELGVKLAWGEEFRSWVHATENLQAFDHFLQADKLYMRFEKEANAQARGLLLKAIELDPKFARAIAFLGSTHVSDAFFGWAKDSDQSYRQAEDLATRAVALDDRDYLAHAVLSRIYAQKGLHEQAIAAGQRAVEVEPSNATAISALAATMTFAGRPEEGLVLIRKAMRLNPYPPLYYFPTGVYASYLTGRYEAAIVEAKKFLKQQRHGPLAGILWQWAIAGYMELGREPEARDETRRLREQHPESSIQAYAKAMKRIPFKDHGFVDRQVEFLRKAGLPD
ncbi:MAG: adenylate/guanylate cyclase domain-containing protein [Candidatus Rokubacteria bacterium]|nr:adenylate/guanylate cyclase domain-containing protein [Candidatus Rokubacteria bacterium]